MNKQGGFTLMELLIAMAIFVVLAMACWRLFAGVTSAERSIASHQQALRSLMRAVAVVERDISEIVEQQPGVSVVLEENLLNFQRGNWRNPLDQPRSESQEVSYTFDETGFWRHSRSLDNALVQRQQLLYGVRGLHWRAFDKLNGWRADRLSGGAAALQAPHALELTFFLERFGQIRRVFIVPQANP